MKGCCLNQVGAGPAVSILQTLLSSVSFSGKDRLSLGKEKVGEDKRKNIKSLIDRIPTTREELFSYPIDSSMVDNVSIPS